MAKETRTQLLGIVGGLGPLASAEFVKTIYEHCLTGDCEQQAPAVLMLSDPSFPDRTQTFLRGEDDLLLGRLAATLEQLCEMGASRIVICCVTMHHVVPRLPPRLRARVISLLDVIFESVAASRREHLLICTNGARRLGVFERHEQWGRLRRYFVLPDERDQDAIHHDLIYQVKQNRNLDELGPLFASLLDKYGVGSFVAGCTEIHLLAKHLLRAGGASDCPPCVDPLTIIAQAVARGATARAA
jgi:aspartate racemase